MQDSNHYVEIIRTENGEVITRHGPMSLFKAERREDVLQVNLNHERFHTRLVTNDTGDFDEVPGA